MQRLDNRILLVSDVIHNQRSGLQFHLWLASGVVLLGLVMIMLAQVLARGPVSEDQKWLVTIGGTFFSSLSSLPIKEIFTRRDRISVLQYVLREFRAINELPDEERRQALEAEQQRLDELVKSAALGAS